MLADLHCHTLVSDGQLEPVALLERALQQQVELLAITDHDAIDGFVQARQYLATKSSDTACSLRLVSGVEFSCVWAKTTVHIVGLNVDLDSPVLQQALTHQQRARSTRGKIIAEKLQKQGVEGSYEGALAIAGDSQLGRPHFAKYLVEQGYVGSIDKAFRRYLGAGKAGDVQATWPDLAQVVGWICASGGTAVIAHPLRYKMTATKLRAMITDFKVAGGQAIEVLSGKQTADQVRYLSQVCERFDLYASCGSDFHRPGPPWSELGCHGILPEDCRPVWSLWD